MSTHALAVLDKALKLTEDGTDNGKRAKRLTELLKAPADEQTAEWFMCVPSCFNSALDIRQTPRKAEGKELLVWTQGSAFSFKAGDTIWDTPKAYLEWGEALKQLSLCVQVQQAIDAVPEKRTSPGGDIIPRNSGVVRFSFLTPNRERTAIVNQGEAELTQDAFVMFLIKGPEAELRRRIPR